MLAAQIPLQYQSRCPLGNRAATGIAAEPLVQPCTRVLQSGIRQAPALQQPFQGADNPFPGNTGGKVNLINGKATHQLSAFPIEISGMKRLPSTLPDDTFTHMGLVSRLHATLALAYFSLFPPASGSRPSTGRGNAPTPYTINADEIAAAIANMGRFTNCDGSLAILFKDALSISAPFLLFRLKRTGFSACRIVRVPGGLVLTARR